MKKTYNQPTCLVVQLGSRDALLTIVSGNQSLPGTSVSNAGTGSAGISDADVKGMTDVNVWDNEW
jgi:hypothetical protein